MGMSIGPLHVRRSIFIESSVERVWQEFESTQRIKRWLNLGHDLHEFEVRTGGNVELSVQIDNEQRFFGGKVLLIEAQRELSFESQWYPPHSFAVPTFWTIRLTPLYEGCGVELFHHGFERLGEAAADALQGYEEGWDVKHLKALRALASD